MNAVEKVIEVVGGPQELASALSAARPYDPVSRDDVYNWRRRGRIPGRFLIPLWELADKLDCAHLIADLEFAASRRKRMAPQRHTRELERV